MELEKYYTCWIERRWHILGLCIVLNPFCAELRFRRKLSVKQCLTNISCLLNLMYPKSNEVLIELFIVHIINLNYLQVQN